MIYKKLYTTNSGQEHLIDTETGELKIAVNPLNYKITSITQREAYLKKLEREERKRSKNWVACYHKSIKLLSSKLTLEEKGAVFFLLPYMNLKRNGEMTLRGERMDVKKIAKAIGKSVPRTKVLLPKLVEAGVLYKEFEGRRVVYGMAPEFHTIGKVQEGYFTKLYQQFTLILKDEYDLNIQLAGVLYAILPYFHYKTYLLCTNPNEQDDKALDPMTERELGELLGVDRSTVNRLMSKLARRGVVAKIGAYGVSIYRVNPDLMYRLGNESDYTEAIRADFQETMKSYKKDNNRTDTVH